MLNMIKRILSISGKYKNKILLGILMNFLKSVSMAMMMFAVYVVVDHLEALSPRVIWTAFGILCGSVAGRFLFQWLMDICMSAKGFDMFRGLPAGHWREDAQSTNGLFFGTAPWKHPDSADIYSNGNWNSIPCLQSPI